MNTIFLFGVDFLEFILSQPRTMIGNVGVFTLSWGVAVRSGKAPYGWKEDAVLVVATGRRDALSQAHQIT